MFAGKGCYLAPAFELSDHGGSKRVLREKTKKWPSISDVTSPRSSLESTPETPRNLPKLSKRPLRKVVKKQPNFQSHTNQIEASVAAQQQEKNSQLLMAVVMGQPFEAIQLVTSGKATNDYRDAYGSTALHYSAGAGFVELTRKLVECASTDVNAINDFDQTPLMWAASRGKLDATQILVEKGADVNARSNSRSSPANSTALGLALANKHEAVAKHLQRQGAET